MDQKALTEQTIRNIIELGLTSPKAAESLAVVSGWVLLKVQGGLNPSVNPMFGGHAVLGEDALSLLEAFNIDPMPKEIGVFSLCKPGALWGCGFVYLAGRKW